MVINARAFFSGMTFCSTMCFTHWSIIEDFLLERDPRFRRMIERVKREKGGMTLSAYRKSRSV